MKKELIISTEEIFKGKIFQVKTHNIKAKDGYAKRELVYHSGGAGILPIDEDGNTYLVRQYRIAYDAFLYEIPAGKIDSGEEALDTARRELLEECGLYANKLKLMHCIYPSPGYVNEKIYIYLATDLEKREQNLDENEELEIHKLSLEEAFQMVKSQEIRDAKSITALLLAREIYQK